jgi:F0F1-type ATP synthase membrane subunit c/vacuolar-type H+-ATPase subunit K
MNIRRAGLLLVIAAALLLAASAAAFGQCAMCKAAIENSANAEEASRGLNLASLVLLIPPVALFSGLFGLIYRFRNVQGRKQDTSAEAITDGF